MRAVMMLSHEAETERDGAMLGCSDKMMGLVEMLEPGGLLDAGRKLKKFDA